MSKLKQAIPAEAAVSAHIAALDPCAQETVQYLREAILAASTEISEHIKWNSPAFYFNGAMQDFDAKEYKRDLAVLNLHRGRIMIVLPTGARITGHDDLLEGQYTDGRRIITIKDKDDAAAKTPSLQRALQQWIQGVAR